MNNQTEMTLGIQKEGASVKAWCKCGQECDCIIKVYSNQTRHAHGDCPKCGSKGAKQQRLPIALDDLKHRLMGIYSCISAMPKGIDKDEAVAMLERLADDLGKTL